MRKEISTAGTAAEEPIIRENTEEETDAKRKALAEPAKVEDVGDMDEYSDKLKRERVAEAAEERATAARSRGIGNLNARSEIFGASAAARLRKQLAESRTTSAKQKDRAIGVASATETEPLIREATEEEAARKRKALGQPEDVEELGDMDSAVHSMKHRAIATETAKRTAPGTQDIFGAHAATKLRRQRS